jgi:release factor glutamine methyltransferase
MSSEADTGLVELSRALSDSGYEFVTVTPETHRRVLLRDDRAARNLRDIFGWSRPFSADVMPPALLELALRARAVEPAGSMLRARVRFSSLDGRLFVHSAFPTGDRDAVFFGPDTYRFCSFLRRSVSRCDRLVDVGCGSGAGGLVAAARAESVVLADVNPLALRFSAVNAAVANRAVDIVESDVLASIEGPFDAVVANPPFLRDLAGRTYRDGGGRWGEELSLRIASEALARLPRAGKLYLYTGAPIAANGDVFRRALTELCRDAGASLIYEELDPDIFGEELSGPGYSEIERIAAVGATITK